MCHISINGKEGDGYVPDDIGIGGGDYITFTYCLDCGKIQGDFPISQEAVNGAIDQEWEEW
jgi:hypothetical protein